MHPTQIEMNTALDALNRERRAVESGDAVAIERAKEKLCDSIQHAPVNVLLIFLAARVDAMRWIFDQQQEETNAPNPKRS